MAIGDDLGGPDLLACTRFGVRIRDRGWLEHRLQLIASITAPSLLAQRDEHFHWLILVDAGLPRDIRRDLQEVLTPFGKRAFIYQLPMDTLEALVGVAQDRGFRGGDPYLLTGRIDDDDAWCTTMVGDARGRVAAWLAQEDRAPGLSLTFQDGLEWIMYEMLDVEALMERGERLVHAAAIRRYRLPFISMSAFVCAQLSDRETALSDAHSRLAERLSSTKGYATDVVSTREPMWLCCRHKQAGSGIRKAQGPEVQLTLADLTSWFGVDERMAQSYIDNADRHQYTLIKAPMARKQELLVKLFQVNRQIEDFKGPDPELARLFREKEKITELLTQLSVDVLGDPEASASKTASSGRTDE